MRVVLSWLGEFVDLDGIAADELAERLTLAGLEVAAVEHVGDWWDRDRLIVGAVTRVEPHPNADRLVLADVDLGPSGSHRVVTGAPNLVAMREHGDLPRPLKVAYAREGAEIFDGHAEGWVKTVLKGRRVRGVMSDAMVCSEKELGLSDRHEDILVLEDEAPVGTPLADVLGDVVLDIDVLPSFARAMCVVGVARETAVLFRRPFAATPPKLREVGTKGAADMVTVDIRAPDLCPRYTARVVDGVTAGPSPAAMARRLTLAGMRSLGNLVDATNYAMLERGEPLHAFDYEILADRADGRPVRIVVRRAEAGEAITTLDGVTRTLDPDALLIADVAGPLAIAGVMGGADTEVGPETTKILLEAAAFDNINIRRTSRRQRIQSESAARFGRGVHPAVAETASRRGAQLLGEVAGGAVVPGVVDAYPRPPKRVVVTLPAGEVRRLLGADLGSDEVMDTLTRLEFDVAPADGGGLTAAVPPHRLDVSCAADLVEEVARIHGFDNLPATTPADPLPPQRDNPRLRAEETARDVLVRTGLQEVVTYRLVTPALDHGVAASAAAAAQPHVELANPISPDRSVLRTSILASLFDVARGNLRFADRVAIFELGPVFHPVAEELPDEEWRVGVLMTGPAWTPTWRAEAPRRLDFFDAKGVVERLGAGLGATLEWAPDPGGHPALHPARTAVVTAGGRTVGHVGELPAATVAAWSLGEGPVAAADLDFGALRAAGGTRRSFQPFSLYPAVKEDVAIVVAEEVAAADVAAVIRGAAGALLADLALFDVYRGAQIGEGRKSLAWSLTLQAPDKTLTSKAAAAVRGRILRALKSELGAELRGG